ncbi:MAG: hypothetical protein M3P86_01825 [Actinomycetota bacterium]|nr:hypothetical protein [Actinomycetota bacterium]
MSTPGMLWFIVWRSVLLGLGLGAGLGAAYGLAMGTIFYLLVPLGILIGPLLGALYGGLAGLLLGIVEGATLWGVALLLRRYGVPGNRYRRIAGGACAAACLTALALFFEITARKSGTSFVSQPSAYLEDMGSMLIMIVGPSLVATGAAWWAGRRVAEQYTREFGEPVSRSPEQASGEKSVEKVRRE